MNRGDSRYRRSGILVVHSRCGNAFALQQSYRVRRSPNGPFSGQILECEPGALHVVPSGGCVSVGVDVGSVCVDQAAQGIGQDEGGRNNLANEASSVPAGC